MGQGPAPAGATIEHYRGEGLDLVPGAGGLAAAVPGAGRRLAPAAARPRHVGARRRPGVRDRLRPRRAPAGGGRRRDDRACGRVVPRRLADVRRTVDAGGTSRRRRGGSCAIRRTPPSSTASCTPRARCATTDRSAAPPASTPHAASGRPGSWRTRRRPSWRSRIGTPAAARTRASSRRTTSPRFEAGYEPAVTREFRGRTIAKAGRVDAGAGAAADARPARTARRRPPRPLAGGRRAHHPRGAEARLRRPRRLVRR